MSRRTVRLAFAAALVLPSLSHESLSHEKMGLAAHGNVLSCARGEVPPPFAATKPAEPAEPAAAVAKAEAVTAEPAKVESTATDPAEPKAPEPTPRERLQSWLGARLPKGGTVVEDGPTLAVEHTAAKGDTVRTLAEAYVDLTTAYNEAELLGAILKANPTVKLGPISEGTKVRIPRVVAEAPKPPKESRLGWPDEDEGALRGIYVNATMAGNVNFPSTLDKLVSRGMNAIVMDAKDVTGFLTYTSKIPLALSLDANKHASVSSYERFVRYAHSKGVRVIARVTCFRDEWVGPRRHDLAIQRRGGGAHVGPGKRVDWLDPANEEVQSYLLSVVDEVLDAGVDEVQLDYVRYPTEGVGNADFKLKERGLTTTGVITDFVRKVHERTQKASVPLSLDVFGVVAWRHQPDIDATGQDLRMLAPHIEALSPMVYPSHFADGFHGYAKPGDHPVVVAIGTKRAVEEVLAANQKVVVRPWVQAFPWHTSVFGASYVAEQIVHAKGGGGVGWLAWNSGGEYGATYSAVPIAKSTLAKK